jgi:hypothetical protein
MPNFVKTKNPSEEREKLGLCAPETKFPVTFGHDEYNVFWLGSAGIREHLTYLRFIE